MRYPHLTVLAVLALAQPCRAADRPPAPAAPNVVFILADDLGGRDVGCYGSTFHQTPHIDALARRGVRFTDAYAASPLCSPTRSSILTGLAPARTGITAPNCHLPAVILDKQLAKGGPAAKVLNAQSVTRLKTDYLTLAEVFRDAGYRTGHFGKWHLGAEPYSPLQHGFDVDLPHTPGPGPGGGNGYFAPWAFWKNQGKPGDHIEDRMADEAVAFIRANKGRPFFLNYWAFSVHSPWMAKPDYTAEAAGRVDPAAPQRNPMYAGMVRSLDDAVGRLTAALDETGLADRTIVVFTSDNGGWHNPAREATAAASPHADVPVTSNAPFRSGKASHYEGGTRVPLLVVWPGRAAAGGTSNAVVQSTDFFPTLLEMANVPTPAGTKFDGLSIAPALVGKPVDRGAIFCHFPHGGRADIDGFLPGTWVRKGNWKLIRFFADGPGGGDRLELYDLAADAGEQKNRAADEPNVVRELNALIDAYLKDTEAVVPTANPAFGGKPAAKAPAAGSAAAGWVAGKDARLDQADALVVRSIGADPYLATRAVPAGAGPYTVSFKMRSDSRGGGQVFWATADDRGFHRDRSVTFEPTHGGGWKEYEVKLPAEKPLTGLRIDPATAPGEIRLQAIRLADKDGRTLGTWPPAAKQ